MVRHTKSKKKLVVRKPIAKSKSMVIQPVQLPVAPEVPPRPRKWGWMIFLMILTAGLWGWLAFELTGMFYPQKNTLPVLPQKVAPQHPTAPVPPAEPEYPENVVALIGDEPITVEEVQEFIQQVPQLSEVPFNQIYPKMLDLYLNNRVVQLGAEELMIADDPQVQNAIRLATEEIITQAYLSNVLEQALTEQDYQNYYDEQVKSFQPQEEIHARHILLDTVEQARNVLIQLQAGADFGALATQKSLDKNAKEGDLGYFTREMMIPEFAEAVFKMQKGELSEPVRTAYGWHIIQVLDKRMTKAPEFKDVKEQMRQAVMQRKIPEILQEQRNKRKVRILRPTLSE